MKTETIYNEIIEAMNAINNSESKKAVYILQEIASALYKDMENKKPSGSLYKAMQKVIKTAGPRATLEGAWMQDGRQYVCNGTILIASAKAFELPAVAGLDGVKLLESNAKSATLPIPLPSVSDLKIAIEADKKAKNKIHRFNLGDGLPLVDSELLLLLMQALPDAECFWSGNILAPIYFRTAEAEAILCVCRK